MSNSVEQAPPNPREMLIIAAGLTLVCLVAAMILGGLYFVTQPAKEHNVQLREQSMIRGLLDLTPQAKILEVRRYLRSAGTQGRDLQVIYMTTRNLVSMDLNGKELGMQAVPEDIAASTSSQMKDEWVFQQLKVSDPEQLKYAGRFFVGVEGTQRSGYVVEGITAGYKNWIRFFMAIDSAYGIRGVEIIEHEEDPGLGAEITQRYFKNQFAGRSLADIDRITVTKDPLPEDWLKALETLGDMPFQPWLEKYRAMLPKNPNIHAITGSTISSAAVTNGIKRALANFRKRMTLVEPYL